jgi:hypothetical protein
MSRPIAPREVIEKKKPMHDPLEQFDSKRRHNKAIFRRY